MKRFLYVFIISAIIISTYLAFSLKAANVTFPEFVTNRTADTSPTGDDLIITINDPSGTQASRKVTLTNFIAQLIDGGNLAIDGDKIELSLTLGTITPDTGIGEADSADDLAAILEGIEDYFDALVAEGGRPNDTIVEADLKVVDSASDEDVFTYESTTGDFEWHSVAEIIAQMAAGGLPNDSILEADLKAVDSATDEDFLTYESTTGDFEWHSKTDLSLGDMNDIVDDTTPQLGGNLDFNGHTVHGVDSTEMGYLDGVTSNIQTQIDGKQASGSYQTLDENLTQLSSGIDNRFNSADLEHAAPGTPEVGDRYVADGVVNNWNPGGLSTATITGGSDISFVEGGGSADTITDGGSGFVTAGFQAGMLIEVSSSTNNNGYYFLTAVAAGTLTLSNINAGITDGDLVDESNTSAQIDGGFPHKVAYDGSSWITENDNVGNSYIKQYQINAQPGGITTDGEFIGLSKLMTAGETLAVGDVIYLANDGEVYKADSDSTTWIANEAVGVAISSGADAGDVTVGIKGTLRLDSWNWTVNEGDPLYLDTTAGDMTETRPTSASTAVQVVATIISDDEIFIDPQPRDFSIVRVATDADGETLTCLECTNTIWEETGATQDITLPAISTCPTINVTLIANNASAIDLDVNAADDTIVDGVANADGEKMTSTSTVGDQASCFIYDSDTLICQTNGWSLE